MPLVVPGLTSNKGEDDKTNKWTNELVGKKIGENSNETTFAKTKLPSDHRVIAPDSMVTADHKPDRLNIHTAEDGTVTKVTHG